MKKKQVVGKAKKVEDDDDNLEAARIGTPFVVDGNNEHQMMNVDLGFGEIAAIRYCMAKISREVQQLNKVKIPHMLHAL